VFDVDDLFRVRVEVAELNGASWVGVPDVFAVHERERRVGPGYALIVRLFCFVNMGIREGPRCSGQSPKGVFYAVAERGVDQIPRTAVEEVLGVIVL
jgi:hypothetical protein